MNTLSGTARFAAGVVALVAWFGLAAQFRASLGLVGAVPETLWVMLRYFTVIANTLAAIIFTGVASGRSGFAAPPRLGGMTVTMLLVGVVYHLLLRGMLELSGGAKLADILMHTATPLLVPAYWLVFAPKGGLSRRDPLLWAVLPLVYFVYALARGAIEGVYAYPFMNVTELGWPQTLATALLMALGFMAAGFVMLWLDRMLSRAETKPA
jgi:hypothetical protein